MFLGREVRESVEQAKWVCEDGSECVDDEHVWRCRGGWGLRVGDASRSDWCRTCGQPYKVVRSCGGMRSGVGLSVRLGSRGVRKKSAICDWFSNGGPAVGIPGGECAQRCSCGMRGSA